MKKLGVASSQTQDTSGLSRQWSATEYIHRVVRVGGCHDSVTSSSQRCPECLFTFSYFRLITSRIPLFHNCPPKLYTTVVLLVIIIASNQYMFANVLVSYIGKGWVTSYLYFEFVKKISLGRTETDEQNRSFKLIPYSGKIWRGL